MYTHMDFTLTSHAEEMLKERAISESWVKRAIETPDWENVGADNNTHYFKRIPEHEGRVLHVVVNRSVSPGRVVTVFFDRKARRER